MTAWRHLIGVSDRTGGPAVYVMRPGADGRFAYGMFEVPADYLDNRSFLAFAWRSARQALKHFLANATAHADRD